MTEELAAEQAQRDAATAGQVPPNAEEAQVDSQAEEIISQIKSASMSIKGLGDNGIDETQLKSAFAGMNLVQLDSDLNLKEKSKQHAAGDFDSNAATALEFMSQTFPEDYPEDHKPPPPPPQPSAAEKAEADRKAFIQYATDVAEDAKAYTDSIKEAEAKKKEDEALAKMGMPGEPVALQLSDNIKLAQVKSKTDSSEGEELQEGAEAAASEAEGKSSAADLFAAKSPAEQAAALQNMNQDELDALSQNLNQIEANAPAAPKAAPAKAKAPAPTKEDYAAAAA